MALRYVVLGAGPLGTAAAFDLASYGEANELVLADPDPARAREAALRVGKLLKGRKTKLKGVGLDMSRKAEVAKALKGADGVVSTLPPTLNATAAKAAVDAKAHYCDVGSGLEIARAILKLDAAARKAGVSVAPNCGLAPGLSSCLAVIAMSSLDFCREVRVYSGALPERPLASLEHATVYPAESPLALYLEPAIALRRGKISTLPPMTEREELEIPGVGMLEACLTGGVGSTSPFTLQNRLVVFEHKTLRYPGHFEKIAAIQAMGFLSADEVSVGQRMVRPREMFLTLVEKASAGQEEKDVVVLRVAARGKKHSRPTEAAYELVDRYDPETGFSAFERTAAFPAAAALALQVRGKFKPGALPPESCLPHRDFLAEVRRRGLKIVESLRTVDA